MNRILLSTSLSLVLSGSLALAQQQDAPPTTTAKHHHAHNPQRETARLTKKLNLSVDQSAKLEPILADRDSKMAALKNDTTISDVDMKQQMKAIHQQTRQQLAALLTPDQLQGPPSRPQRSSPDRASVSPSTRPLTRNGS